MIKDVLVRNPPRGVAPTLYPVPKKETVAEGTCITCENKSHCVWLENKKIYCEHYQ